MAIIFIKMFKFGNIDMADLLLLNKIINFARKKTDKH